MSSEEYKPFDYLEQKGERATTKKDTPKTEPKTDISQEEGPPKMNWQQKIQYKLLLRKLRKIIKKIEWSEEDEYKTREKVITAIMGLDEIFEMETDDNKPMTEADLRIMPNDKLVKTLEQGVEALSKITSTT